jgi:uncharacterized protein YdaT
MATKEKLVEMTFVKTPPGYAYVAPNTYEVPEKLANKLNKQGFCYASDKVLPVDIPFRKELIDANIDTLDELKSENDFTKHDGVTAPMAAAIGKWLNKHEQSEKIRKQKIADQKKADAESDEKDSEKKDEKKE